MSDAETTTVSPCTTWGSYRSAHVLLNLLNELRKSYQMPGLPSILSLFHNKFDKFNNTGAHLSIIQEHECNILFITWHQDKKKIPFFA